MAIVKVAGIQASCGESREENLSRAAELARLAVENGAKIVCFQELFSTLWFPRERSPDFFSLAEGEDGPSLSLFRGLAAEVEAAFVCPVFEKSGEGRYYNTAFVIGPDGGTVGRYRKVHVPDIPLWEEKHYFQPGDTGLPVFECQGLSFGVQLGWDNFFPEGVRRIALAGGQLVFSPTAAAFASAHRWETVISASAIVNNIYLFRVNRVGREAKQDFYGRSFCVSPEGEMLLEPAGMANSVVMAEIDTDLIEEVRREWKFLEDRREDVY